MVGDQLDELERFTNALRAEATKVGPGMHLRVIRWKARRLFSAEYGYMNLFHLLGRPGCPRG